jgi:hypothetical protein
MDVLAVPGGLPRRSLARARLAFAVAGDGAWSGPTWYVLFQALLGVIQFVIGLAMLVGYRRAGAWAAF